MSTTAAQHQPAKRSRRRLILAVLALAPLLFSLPARGQGPTQGLAGGRPHLQGKTRTATGQRIHLQDIALKLAMPNNPIYSRYLHYHHYFNRPAVRLFKLPQPAQKPSAFERRLRRLWQPEKLDPTIPITDRKGRLPSAFPWSSPVTDQGHYDEASFFRGSVINALATFADADGYLDWRKLRQELSHNALEQDILKILEAPKPKRLAAGITWSHVLEYLNRPTLHKMGPKLGRGLRPRDMHALRWVREHHDPSAALGGIKRVWGMQHILGNTHEFLEATGLKPARVDLWGKFYSLDPRAAVGMELAGFSVHGDTIPNSRRVIERQIANELKAIKNPEQVHKPLFLLLDDGGELIEIAARYIRKNFPKHAHLFAAVEQTQGGMNRIAKLDLPFRVIGSGSSWAKKKYGSPMFGVAVGKAAHRVIDYIDLLPTRRARARGTAPRKLTLLGFGDVGKYTARYLKKQGFDVVVYDKDPAKRRAARKEGFKALSRKAKALQHADYLVSCVGRTAFRHSSFFHLPEKAVVINGGSVNELPRKGEPLGLPKLTSSSHQGRDTFRRLISDDPQKNKDARVMGLVFAKDGGVINFPQDANDPQAGKLIPGRYIQLQLGLLYLDLLQAAKGGSPGIHQTPLKLQKELVTQVQRQLSKSHESLLNPRW